MVAEDKNAFSHETVLLEEAVDALLTDTQGAYVDATFGRGGHSRKVLAALSDDGALLGIDKDLVAVEVGKALSREDGRFTMAHGSFSKIDEFVDAWSKGHKVSGVLADLGVSSPQLDDASRGFSFMQDGPLDMRMDISRGKSAAEWIASVGEAEMAETFKAYGEERFAKRIARAICERRQSEVFSSTLQLAKVVAEAHPAWEKHKHPATRVFQAIRIKINDELGDLATFLERAANLLVVGGRLVIISFHSLEDRMVKRFMRDKAQGDAPPPGVPVKEEDIVRNYKMYSRAIKPSPQEVAQNIRSRSAVMRVLEKVGNE